MSQFSSGVLTPNTNRLGVNTEEEEFFRQLQPSSPFSPSRGDGRERGVGLRGNVTRRPGGPEPFSPDPFPRTQGFAPGEDTGPAFPGGLNFTGRTSTIQNRPIFTTESLVRSKIISANLDPTSATFSSDLQTLFNSFPDERQKQIAQDLFSQASGGSQGGGDAFNQGVDQASNQEFPINVNVSGGGGQRGIQGGAFDESLIGLIGSLIQSLLTSGQFASGGGVQPPAPQALFRTDLDRLGANRF